MSSPYINHFLQPDSIIPDLSNPQYLNRYSYVVNSPILYNDPDGHCGGPACVIVIPVALIALVAIGVTYYSQPQVQAAGREFMSSVSELINQAKSGEPSIKHRTKETELSTLGQIVDGDPSKGGPMFRGGGKGCNDPYVLILICIGVPLTIAGRVLKSLTSGSYGEDETIDQLPNTLTPTSTPTPTSTSTPTSTPAITPVPYFLPRRPSHRAPIIPY